MNWKKLMAVTMALCMAVPSGIPQTIMGAEFTQETQTQVTEVSEFDDGMGNDCDATEAENIEDLFGSEDFSTGKAEEINDNSQDIPDLKENEGEDITESAGTEDGYKIKLYSNGKLEKTYTVSREKAEDAKAPAAPAARRGYIFKEWNTQKDGKGTSYKPGDSIAELLHSVSSEAELPVGQEAELKNSNVESADVENVNTENVNTDNEENTADELFEEIAVQNLEEPSAEDVVENTEEPSAGDAAVQNTVPGADAVSAGDSETPGVDTAQNNDLSTEAQSTENSTAQTEPAVQEETSDNSESQNQNIEETAAGVEEDSDTVVLYAIWQKAASYKIIYKLNGGKNSSANPKTYKQNTEVKLKKPTRSGYHFAGWYTDSKYKTKITTIKKGTAKNITLYARWTKVVKISSKAASLKYVKGYSAGQIRVSATVPQYVKTWDNYYYLLYLDSATGKVKKTVDKIKKSDLANQKLTFKLKTKGHPEYIQGKFAIGAKNSKGSYSVISNRSYVSNPEKLASYQAAYFIPKTKKGIQATDINQITETKSKNVFVNFFASDILNTGYGYNEYKYNGKKYYFAALYGYKNLVSECNQKGIQVTAQISLNNSSLTQSLRRANSPYGETAYYGWNTDNSAARQKMEALFAYLGETFGSNGCYISNWILGNEVNSASCYYYLGNVSFSKYISMYSEAFRCLHNAVRSTRASSKVFICLDNCWNQRNIFSVCYTSKSTLDKFASTVSKLQKGISWNVAYHAYSQPLTEAKFWSSVNEPLLTKSGETATFITMYNIEALTSYVKNHYGSDKRVFLSEQGFSSSYGGQVNQAASMALAYYKAACNPMIDGFIIRSYMDESHEVAQGLALGLKTSNGKAKKVYNVFRYMDSSSSLKYTEKILNSQVGNWKFLVPGYKASRVYKMYRN